MRSAAIAFLVLPFLAASALADGRMFSSVGGAAKVEIPDQSALITFEGKTERLVIETSFRGEGKDFAWVVPLPAVPQIEASTPGLFPTLRAITRPRVVGYDEAGFGLAIFGLVVVVLIWGFLYSGTTRGRKGWSDAAVVFLILLILAGMLLPALGHSRAAGNVAVPNGLVTVHARQVVGAYETATVSGKDGAAIADWLKTNGYALPESVRPALEEYARESWVFVAARLRADSAAQGASTHPLSFVFPTQHAIYPMRLTGIENGPMTLDLFVAGQVQAACPSFQVRRAGKLDFKIGQDDEGYTYSPSKDDFIPVAHEGLKAYLNGLTVLTHLSCRFDPGRTEDIAPDWRPVSPQREVLFMPGAALQQALLWPIGLLFLVGLVSCYVCRARYPNGMSPANSLLLSIGAIIVSGAAVVLPVYLFCFRFWGSATSVPFWAFSALVLCALLAVPLGFAAVRYEAKIRKLALTDVLIVPRPPWQVPAGSLLVAVVLGACLFVIPRKIASDQVLTNWRSFADQYDHQRLAERVAGRVALGPDALAQARQVFAEEWQGRGQGMAGNRRFNEFTGLPVREEDSPGNYVIEASGGNIQYYYIDANGRKTLVWDSGKKRTEN